MKILVENVGRHDIVKGNIGEGTISISDKLSQINVEKIIETPLIVKGVEKGLVQVFACATCLVVPLILKKMLLQIFKMSSKLENFKALT